MSETKRIVPTTVGVQKSNKNKVKDVIKTFRFALTLTESNDKACPIFNYKDLLASAKKKGSESNISNGHDSQENGTDSDVQRLAKHFEAKYGGHGTSKTSKNKVKKHFKDDYTDVGAGYDESDSFIDNTEAYDEIVPEDIYPAHGGFYINSGSLEFKQQDISDRDDGSSPVTSTTTKTKKRVIESEESDDEEDDDDDDDEEEAVEEDAKINHLDKKIKLNNETEKPNKKKIIPSSDENKESGIQIPIPKKKIIPDSNPVKVKPATVKELLKERREDSESSVEINKNSEQTKDIVVTNDKKIPIVSTSINDAIESVISAAMEGESDESSKDSSRSKELTSTQSEESSEFESEQKNNSQTIVTPAVMLPPETKLPEKLSEDVKNIVEVLKNVCNNSGQKLTFSESVNKLLLRLEHYCMSLSNSTRLQIYAYLASVLQCKRDTLINKVRKLLLNEENYKLQDLIKRLKELIEKQMPGLLDDYSKECARVNEKRLTQDQHTDVMTEEKPKTFRMPKRRFPWMEETRKMLGEIISIKRRFYQIERVKEKFDQYLEPFYKEDLMPLWPEGWISLTTLLKESQPFLAISEKTIKKDPKKVVSNSSDVSAKSGVNNVNNYVAEVISNNLIENKHNTKTTEVASMKTVAQISIKPISSQSSITLKSNNTTITTTKNSLINQTKIVSKPIPLNTNCGITIEPIINRTTDTERKNLKRKTPIPPDISVQNNSAVISESSKIKNINGKENEATNTCNDIGISKVQVITGPVINVSKTSSKKIPSVQNSSIETKKIRLDPSVDLKKNRIEHSTDSKKVRVDPSTDQKKIRVDPSTEQKKAKSDSLLDQKKIRNESSLEQKKVKLDNGPVISVRKLTDLTSTNSKVDVHPKKSKSPVKEKLSQQAEKQSTIDDIEIIEIVDDDDDVDNTDKQLDYKKPGPKSKTKNFSSDNSKKVAQNVSDSNKKSSELEKDVLPPISSGKMSETDLDDKLKSQNSDQLSYDDVSQVMKHLKELQKLTGISDKSKDNDGVLSHKSSSSPVSVITVNSCKYSSAKSSALSPTGLSKATSDLIGFQDVFQKHLSQEKKDCSSTISNCNFTQGKDNIESYSYIGSMNPTTSPVVSTSQKYAQNTNVNPGATLLNFSQSTPLPPTGSVSKSDVFPNFMFEYFLNKSTGSSQKSPPY